MNKVKYVLFLFLAFYIQSSFSQDGQWVTTRDLETWGSLKIKYKINKKWKIAIEEQFRFSNNSSELDNYFTELNTDYSFNKNVFGGIGFRYIRENDNVGETQGYENHTRLHFDLGYKHELQRFELEYRLRFQTKNELDISKEEGDYANNHLRFKVGLGYNIKKWKLDPEFSSEIFRHYEKGEENGFNKIRFTIGTKYKTKSFGNIGAFYRIERELNVNYPKTTFILGVKYTYTLKNKKK